MWGMSVGNSASGVPAVRVFQANAGSLPSVLCAEMGVAYPRCGRSFRPIAV